MVHNLNPIFKMCFLAVVEEKWNRVTQEFQWNVEIEGDRRRTSMLVINVLDCDHYLAALSDFLMTIAQTMVEDQRPPPPNRQDGRPGGRLIKFEEGILCQVKSQIRTKSSTFKTINNFITNLFRKEQYIQESWPSLAQLWI